MPPRKKIEEKVPDLDALLTSTPEKTSDDSAPEKTPEQKEIERLQAELEAERNAKATHPTDDAGRPLPQSALTPEQATIRNLEDQVAQAKAARILSAQDAFDSGELVTIHFVEDGFTAQGKVWLTGQTVSFGQKSYDQTKDRYGNSWLDLDESQQYTRYGKVYFRKGAWTGARYDDEVAKEDLKRGSAAPVINL